MKNKILLSTGTLYTYSLERIFELAKKAGFDGIELIIDNREESQDAKYLKNLQKTTGIKIISVHCAMEFVKTWGDDHRVRLQKSIELAKDLGVKILVVHPSEANKPPFYPWFKGNLEEIEKQAAPIEIAVENLHKAYSKYDVGSSVFQNYLPRYFTKFEKMAFDTSHFATLGKPERLIEMAKYWRQFKILHLSDSSLVPDPEREKTIGDNHQIPGTGRLPLREFLDQVLKNGYIGPIVIELQPKSVQADKSESTVLSNLKVALRFVKNTNS